MDNSVDKLMDGWGAQADPDKLFSDQIEDDTAFMFEEPGIGIKDLILDEPQSGIVKVPSDVRTKSKKTEVLPSEGDPNIFNAEKEELIKLVKEKQENDRDAKLSVLFGYISEYGLIAGMNLYLENKYQNIEENYGEEESLGQSPGDIQASE